MPYRALRDAAHRPGTASVLLALALAFSWLVPAPGAGAAEKPALSGRIVDEDARPLAGATVELRPVVGSWEKARGELPGSERQATATTSTDEDGRYRLAVPDTGFWELVAGAPERVPARLEVGPVEGPEAADEMILYPAVPVEVLVVDAQGEPVRGARIAVEGDGGRLTRHRARTSTLGRSARQVAVTGEDGSAAVARREGETLAVSAMAEGFAPVALVEEADATITLRLAPGEPITVEVRDAAGDPVPEALLRFGQSRVSLGLTGEDGRLTFGRDPGAELALMALSPAGPWRRHVVDGKPAETGGNGNGDDGGAEPVELAVVELPPLVTLTGRTLESTERTAVAGAWVWSSGFSHAAVRSDSRGNFSLPTPATERPLLRADAGGYGGSSVRLRQEQVADGGPVTILLAATAVAAGRVVDGEGQPVAGARLRAVPDGSRRSYRIDASGETFTGPDGRFTLDELSVDTPHTLTAVHPDFAPASLHLEALPAGARRQGLEIALGTASVAFGRVVDVDEVAVPGAEVTLTPALASSEITALLLAARSGVPPATATTDREGYFEIGGLADGRFDLAADAAGFAPLAVPGVELPPGGGRVDLGTLFLEPGLRLEGRVVDSNGEPVAEVRVWARDDNAMGMGGLIGAESREADARTGPDGRFVVDGLARGNLQTVWAEAEGYTRASLSGVEVPAEEPLRIVLERSAKVSGVVTDSSGAPVEDARVTVRAEPGAEINLRTFFANATSDEDGEFTVEDVTPGRLMLLTSAEGFLADERAGLEVVAGETLDDVRIVLEPGATVTGRVMDSLGNPLPATRVGIVRDETAIAFSGGTSDRTDADGVYHMHGVPPGERSVEANHEDHQRQVRDLTVVPGENRLDFRLQAGVSVSGRVVGEGGAPVAGALVSAVLAGDHPGLRPDGETTDGSGAFRLEGLSPGAYSLTARKDGFAVTTLEEQVELTGGPVQGVEIQLRRGAIVTGRLLGAELEELAGATVVAGNFARQDRMPLIGRVDYEGRFRIEGVPAGEWTLVAVLSDGLPAAQEPLTVAPGQREASVDIDLGADKASLRGRIRIGGEPAASAYLSLAGKDTAARGFGRTDHQGRFEVRGLEDGTYEMEIFQLASGQTRVETVEVRGDTEIDLDIEVSSVSGVVIADGEPVERARVEIERADAAPVVRQPVRTDPAGRFRIARVAAGTYRLRASAEGYAPGEATVTVEDTTPLTGVEIRLQPAGGLVLEVRGAYGTPPEQVRVAALEPGRVASPGDLPANGGPPTVYAMRRPVREEGRVRLDGLPPGSWDLLVGDGRSAVVRRRVTSPGPPVVIPLERGHLLTVRVPDLAEVGQFGRVEITGADGRRFIGLGWSGDVQSNWMMNSGEARVDHLPAGRWTVTASTPDGRTWSGSAVTAGGAPAEVVLE